MYGNLPFEISLKDNEIYPPLEEARKLAKERTKQYYKKNKIRYDKKFQEADFKVFDLVMYEKFQYPNTRKLSPPYSGPHAVLRKCSDVLFETDRPNALNKTDTELVHSVRLRHFHPSENFQLNYVQQNTHNNENKKITKRNLLRRALDWFEVLVYRVVEDKAMDYAHLKQALTEQFPVVRNRLELETRFFASSQKHNQKPSDFVYDLLKIHKILKLEMLEEKLIDHVISRNRQENWREPRGNNRYSDNSRPRRKFNTFESQDVADNRRFDGRRRGGQSDHRFHNQGGRQGGLRNCAFREIPPDTEHRTIRISSLRMTPVDLPYVPILLNETFITALWDTGVEKFFISEEVYHKYFSYRPRQKTKDRVVTAQGAPCCPLSWVELQSRIREFQKTLEFYILNSMQYQCILGIDFMKESKLTLDFDQKSLIIPNDQIKQLPKVENLVEIDLSDTKLGEEQKQKLKDLFNGFKGQFSDQTVLTHVLYHEIDTGDQGPKVSRPYQYDRVKQGKIDYHIKKMLQEGTIQPPYASPVVLTRKNNGLPPDSPKAYRFAIDYRKLNAIT
ncbi:uncharacterized protein TNCV_4699801 [Trichonephila clavipes]|nr:uncharacterized protein TNCV_4699801 [Trichonephila clavipes]